MLPEIIRNQLPHSFMGFKSLGFVRRTEKWGQRSEAWFVEFEM